MKTLLKTVRIAWMAVALALAAGCTTIEYRNVQSDFEKAVRADLEGGQLPYVDWYRSVATELTPDYIAKLDASLQPNAWLLRALSQWRSEDFAGAKSSASAGIEALKTLAANDARWERSRDKILLTMVPGLIKDSELQVRLRQAGPSDLAQHFQDIYQPEIVAALTQFKEAHAFISESTPKSVTDYWSFQTWRLLQNWATYCVRLPTNDDRGAALTQADELVAAGFSGMLGGAHSLETGRAYLLKQLGPQHLYLQIVQSNGDGKLIGP